MVRAGMSRARLIVIPRNRWLRVSIRSPVCVAEVGAGPLTTSNQLACIEGRSYANDGKGDPYRLGQFLYLLPPRKSTLPRVTRADEIVHGQLAKNFV